MGRRRKGPWLRKQDNCWYTTLNRKSIKLGHGGQPYSEIEQAYHELLAKRAKPANVSLAWLIEQFLDDVERTKSKRTHEWFKRYLDCFLGYFGPRLRPENLAPEMVNRWIGDKYQHASPSTHNGAPRQRTTHSYLSAATAPRVAPGQPLLSYRRQVGH